MGNKKYFESYKNYFKNYKKYEQNVAVSFEVFWGLNKRIFGGYWGFSYKKSAFSYKNPLRLVKNVAKPVYKYKNNPLHVTFVAIIVTFVAIVVIFVAVQLFK